MLCPPILQLLFVATWTIATYSFSRRTSPLLVARCLRFMKEGLRRLLESQSLLLFVSLGSSSSAGVAISAAALAVSTFMLRDHSCLLNTGTNVVKAVTNEGVTQEELGGTRTIRFRRRHHRYEHEQSCGLRETRDTCVAEYGIPAVEVYPLVERMPVGIFRDLLLCVNGSTEFFLLPYVMC